MEEALEEKTCVTCGMTLYEPRNGERSPCRVCGGLGRSASELVYCGIDARDGSADGLTDGKTGRSALHFDTENPTDIEFIESHIAHFVEGDPTRFETYVHSLVSAFCSSLGAHSATFFRGVSEEVRHKVVGSRIGPAPESEDGRYNSPGEKCIYLIDNPDFLSAELDAAIVQKYSIPVSVLRIANLSAGNAHVSNSLSLVLQMTERGRTSSGFDFETQLESNGGSPYALSQAVASAFKQRGWQGMYVPGVHGRQGETYNNLALFGACVDDWESLNVDDYDEVPASIREKCGVLKGPGSQ